MISVITKYLFNCYQLDLYDFALFTNFMNLNSGCVIGRGEDYKGAANTTASGLPCLPWDHPKVQEGLARRFTPQERSARLTGHNYCRNLGGNDRHPWCFVEGKGNSEYCAIPQCYESGNGFNYSYDE